MRRWIEIAVTVPPEAADAVSDHLTGMGAPGVILEDPSELRPGCRLRAHYAESETPGRELLVRGLRRFLASIEPFFPGSGAASIETAFVVDEDWAEGWKQGFPPIPVGRRLLVAPPWFDADETDRLVVTIEPAMAFGTGQHPTTRGCLCLLERLADGDALRSPVLDVGSGSGILAIAAVRLGASQVVGVEPDAVAAEAARENVRRNGVDDAVRIVDGSLAQATPDRFTVLLANIYTSVLEDLYPRLAERALPGAALITSGFLDADAEPLARAAAGSGWKLDDTLSIEGWSSQLFRRLPG